MDAVAEKAAAGLRNAASRALPKIRCVNLNLYSLAIINALENNMTKICKWGNSLGLRLPKETAANAGLIAGTRVRVRLLDNGSIMVTSLVVEVALTGEQATAKPATPTGRW